MAENSEEQVTAEQTVEERTPSDGEAARVEQQRMKWAGVLLAALAIFAGGFAIGQAAENDSGPVAGDRFEFDDELPPAIAERLDRIEERLDAFEIPDVPRGPFGNGERFDFPDDFPCRVLEGDRGEFRLECDFDGDFRLPEGFEDCPFFDGDCPWLDDEPGDATGRAGFLGVEIVETPRGVVVRTVVEGSPAAEAGIEPRDVVLEFDGMEIDSADQLAGLITDARAGTEVEIILLRFDSEVTVTVELSARPD